MSPVTARRMPLYPLFLAAMYAVTGNDEDSSLVVGPVQPLMMVLNVWLVMSLARVCFGERVDWRQRSLAFPDSCLRASWTRDSDAGQCPAIRACPADLDADGAARATSPRRAAFDRLRQDGMSEPDADRALFGRGLRYVLDHPGEAAATPARVAGALLAVVGVALWTGQIVDVLMIQQRGLAGLGISFNLVGLAGVAGVVLAPHSRYVYLLIATYLSQLSVCILFIPIVRIR